MEPLNYNSEEQRSARSSNLHQDSAECDSTSLAQSLVKNLIYM